MAGVVPRIGWCIVGGESGSGARPFNLDWAHKIVDQCKAAAVACFVKQIGARPVLPVPEKWPGPEMHLPVATNDRKGGDWNDWPEDLRVREFPRT